MGVREGHGGRRVHGVDSVEGVDGVGVCSSKPKATSGEQAVRSGGGQATVDASGAKHARAASPGGGVAPTPEATREYGAGADGSKGGAGNGGAGGGAVAGKSGAGGADGQHRHGATSHDFFHRKSQELSMKHLVRHPRMQPFAPSEGRFGLEGAFEAIKLLGRGGTGQTWLCRDRKDGATVAVKLQQRPLPRGTLDLAYNEIVIQAEVGYGSPHMAMLREVMLTPSHLALVLEYEPGGSCAEYVAKAIPRVAKSDLCVPEDVARYMFKQLIAGVEYLHSLHVAHRDIKLDNTLLGAGDPPPIKLCDFQFAKYWGAPGVARSTTHLGTAVYMAPEVITNRRDHSAYDPVEADVWACGIWLVALLVGAFPFDNRPGVDDRTAEQQILRQELDAPWHASKFVRPYVGKLSDGCVDLLDRILAIDPKKRIGLHDIAGHAWMAKTLPEPYEEAWQDMRRKAVQARARMRATPHDQDLVVRRNNVVFAAVREAATHEDPRGSYEALASGPLPPMVDVDSCPNVIRIDVRPEAVSIKKRAERMAGLLDAPLEEDEEEGEESEGGQDEEQGRHHAHQRAGNDEDQEESEEAKARAKAALAEHARQAREAAKAAAEAGLTQDEDHVLTPEEVDQLANQVERGIADDLDDVKPKKQG